MLMRTRYTMRDLQADLREGHLRLEEAAPLPKPVTAVVPAAPPALESVTAILPAAPPSHEPPVSNDDSRRLQLHSADTVISAKIITTYRIGGTGKKRSIKGRKRQKQGFILTCGADSAPMV